MSMGERQEDQKWIEDLRAENIARAAGIAGEKVAGAGSRLDEAVEVALALRPFDPDKVTVGEYLHGFDDDDRENSFVPSSSHPFLCCWGSRWRLCVTTTRTVGGSTGRAACRQVTSRSRSTPPAWEKVMSRHTAGPWAFSHNGHYFEVSRVGDAKYRGEICNAHSAEHISGITNEEAEANARLIAAAPELLEVCETVAESLCELEVQARNASRADTLGGLDQATIQRMLARLADALAVEQDALRPAIARATQPLPPTSEEV